jgi:hypothetical protein
VYAIDLGRSSARPSYRSADPLSSFDWLEEVDALAELASFIEPDAVRVAARSSADCLSANSPATASAWAAAIALVGTRFRLVGSGIHPGITRNCMATLDTDCPEAVSSRSRTMLHFYR